MTETQAPTATEAPTENEAPTATEAGPASADVVWSGKTYGDVLRSLRSLFPPALLDGDGWERLAARADEFPREAVRNFGPEFLLHDPDPAADFFLVMTPVDPEAKYFLERGAAAPPGSPAANFAWYLTEIAKPDSPLVEWTNCAYVAYDLIRSHGASAGEDPGIYIRLRTKKEPGPEADHLVRLAREHTAPVLGKIVGWPPDPREQQMVERAFDALPESASLCWAGAIPWRKRSIRLVASSIVSSEVLAFLERLEWPGSMETVERALRAMEGFYTDRSLLSFNISADGPAPSLGLEAHAGESRDWVKTGVNECRPVIERLVEEGWCLPAKAEALLGWLGRERIFMGEGASLVWKGLNHVKVAIKGEAVGSKAYVGIAVVPIETLVTAVEEEAERAAAEAAKEAEASAEETAEGEEASASAAEEPAATPVAADEEVAAPAATA